MKYWSGTVDVFDSVTNGTNELALYQVYLWKENLKLSCPIHLKNKCIKIWKSTEKHFSVFLGTINPTKHQDLLTGMTKNTVLFQKAKPQANGKKIQKWT